MVPVLPFNGKDFTPRGRYLKGSIISTFLGTSKVKILSDMPLFSLMFLSSMVLTTSPPLSPSSILCGSQNPSSTHSLMPEYCDLGSLGFKFRV